MQALIFEKASSIRLRSGEYSGKHTPECITIRLSVHRQSSVLVIVRHLSYLGHLLREYQAVIKPRAVYHLIIIYRNNELLNVSMIECFFDMASTSQQLSPVIQQIRQH